MYCHKCGTGLPADANFCAKCGTKTVLVSSARVEAHTEGSQQTMLTAELTTLEAMRERGALTDGEFHGAKAETLDPTPLPPPQVSPANASASSDGFAYKAGQYFGEPKSSVLLVVQNVVGVMLFCLFHRGVWSVQKYGGFGFGFWLVNVLAPLGFAVLVTGIAFVFFPKAMRTAWLKVFVAVAWSLSAISVIGSHFLGRI